MDVGRADKLALGRYWNTKKTVYNYRTVVRVMCWINPWEFVYAQSEADGLTIAIGLMILAVMEATFCWAELTAAWHFWRTVIRDQMWCCRLFWTVIKVKVKAQVKSLDQVETSLPTSQLPRWSLEMAPLLHIELFGLWQSLWQSQGRTFVIPT